MHKIMIIDDDIINQKITKEILQDKYDIVPVLSGENALRILNKTMSLPSLILLDISMPKMNGFEVISLMKNNPVLRKIPVIFLTAHYEEAEELEGLRLGAIDYIRKPYVPAILLKRLELHIENFEKSQKLDELLGETEK